jgi:hypothetical protein
LRHRKDCFDAGILDCGVEIILSALEIVVFDIEKAVSGPGIRTCDTGCAPPLLMPNPGLIRNPEGPGTFFGDAPSQVSLTGSDSAVSDLAAGVLGKGSWRPEDEPARVPRDMRARTRGFAS